MEALTNPDTFNQNNHQPQSQGRASSLQRQSLEPSDSVEAQSRRAEERRLPPSRNSQGSALSVKYSIHGNNEPILMRSNFGQKYVNYADSSSKVSQSSKEHLLEPSSTPAPEDDDYKVMSRRQMQRPPRTDRGHGDIYPHFQVRDDALYEPKGLNNFPTEEEVYAAPPYDHYADHLTGENEQLTYSNEVDTIEAIVEANPDLNSLYHPSAHPEDQFPVDESIMSLQQQKMNLEQQKEIIDRQILEWHRQRQLNQSEGQQEEMISDEQSMSQQHDAVPKTHHYDPYAARGMSGHNQSSFEHGTPSYVPSPQENFHQQPDAASRNQVQGMLRPRLSEVSLKKNISQSSAKNITRRQNDKNQEEQKSHNLQMQEQYIQIKDEKFTDREPESSQSEQQKFSPLQNSYMAHQSTGNETAPGHHTSNSQMVNPNSQQQSAAYNSFTLEAHYVPVGVNQSQVKYYEENQSSDQQQSFIVQDNQSSSQGEGFGTFQPALQEHEALRNQNEQDLKRLMIGYQPLRQGLGSSKKVQMVQNTAKDWGVSPTQSHNQMNPWERSSSNPLNEGTKRKPNNEYEEYHNLYYHRLKKAQVLRDSNSHFASSNIKVSKHHKKAGKYSEREIEKLGLGDAKNLAAFDLPLSRCMSSHSVNHYQSQSQGQGGGSQYDRTSLHGEDTQHTGMLRNGIEFDVSGQKTARHGSARPAKTMKDGGQDRVNQITDQMLRSGLYIDNRSNYKIPAREFELNQDTFNQRVPITERDHLRPNFAPNLGYSRQQASPNHHLQRASLTERGNVGNPSHSQSYNASQNQSHRPQLLNISQQSLSYAPKYQRCQSVRSRTTCANPRATPEPSSSILQMQVPKKKFSPAQSRQSGSRLHDNHALYVNKKKELAAEVDHDIMSQVQQKPTINKKSISLLDLRMRLQKQHEAKTHNDYCRNEEEVDKEMYMPNFKHNHENCYYSKKFMDDIIECTHRPKLCKKSKLIIENKMLRNLKQQAICQTQRNKENNSELMVGQLQQRNNIIINQPILGASRQLTGASKGNISVKSAKQLNNQDIYVDDYQLQSSHKMSQNQLQSQEFKIMQNIQKKQTSKGHKKFLNRVINEELAQQSHSQAQRPLTEVGNHVIQPWENLPLQMPSSKLINTNTPGEKGSIPSGQVYQQQIYEKLKNESSSNKGSSNQINHQSCSNKDFAVKQFGTMSSIANHTTNTAAPNDPRQTTPNEPQSSKLGAMDDYLNINIKPNSQINTGQTKQFTCNNETSNPMSSSKHGAFSAGLEQEVMSFNKSPDSKNLKKMTLEDRINSKIKSCKFLSNQQKQNIITTRSQISNKISDVNRSVKFSPDSAANIPSTTKRAKSQLNLRHAENSASRKSKKSSQKRSRHSVGSGTQSRGSRGSKGSKKKSKQLNQDLQVRSSVNVIKLNKKQMNQIKQAMVQKPKIGFGTKIPNHLLGPNILSTKHIKIRKPQAQSKKVTPRNNSEFYHKNMDWLNKKLNNIEIKQMEKKVDEMKNCKFSPEISIIDMNNYQTKTAQESIDYSDYRNYRDALAPRSYREISDNKKVYDKYLKQILKPPQFQTKGRAQSNRNNAVYSSLNMQPYPNQNLRAEQQMHQHNRSSSFQQSQMPQMSLFGGTGNTDNSAGLRHLMRQSESGGGVISTIEHQVHQEGSRINESSQLNISNLNNQTSIADNSVNPFGNFLDTRPISYHNETTHRERLESGQNESTPRYPKQQSYDQGVDILSGGQNNQNTSQGGPIQYQHRQQDFYTFQQRSGGSRPNYQQQTNMNGGSVGTIQYRSAEDQLSQNEYSLEQQQKQQLQYLRQQHEQQQYQLRNSVNNLNDNNDYNQELGNFSFRESSNVKSPGVTSSRVNEQITTSDAKRFRGLPRRTDESISSDGALRQQCGSNPKHDYYSMLQNKPMAYQEDFQERFKDYDHEQKVEYYLNQH